MPSAETANIIDIRPPDTETQCLVQNCHRRAKKEVLIEYDDDPPGMTIHTYYCKSCLADYTKKVDKANIFNE